MTQHIKVLVTTGNKETNKAWDVTQSRDDARKPIRITAVKGARYQLEDPVAQNTGPENIRSKRVGKDLHVLLDGSTEADLIIEGYYDDTLLGESHRGLYGLAEDGKLYEYIPENADLAGLPINLADGGRLVSQVLGEGAVGEQLMGVLQPVAGFNSLITGATAVGVAASGNKSVPPAAVLDTTAPTMPTGVLVSANGAQLTGSGEPGTTVTVKLTDGITTLGTAVVAGDGSFTVALSPAQADGQTLWVTASDAGGTSTPVIATAPDTTPPLAPISAPASYADNVGSVTNTASTAATTDDTTPGIYVGTGLTDTPKLYVDGVQVAATYDSSTGTLTPSAGLTDGAKALSYTLTDAAGNESGRSVALSVTVDTAAPSAATGLTVTPSGGTVVADTLNSTNTALAFGATITAGQATGGKAEFYVGTTLIGTDSAIGAGDTSVAYSTSDGSPTAAELQAAIAAGGVVTLKLYDAAGNVVSSTGSTLVRDVAAPSTPAVPASYADNVGSVTNTASTAATTDDTTPGIYVGTGLTDTPKLYVDGVQVAATYDSSTGTLTPSAGLTDGAKALSYTLTDAAGNESGRSVALSVTVDTAAPTAPVITTVYSDSGVVGDVAHNSSTGDLTPTVRGTAEALSTITIFDPVSTTVYGTTTADSSGNWSYTPGSNLAAGTYRFAAKASDAAGNTGANSNTYTITVNVPVAPTSVGGSQAYGGLGLSLNSAGDFNNDGYQDFIASAPQNQYAEGAINAADIYLIYGTANGIPSISNVDNMTAAQGIHYTNSASGFDSYTGTVVKGIGDLNGDGYSDVVIGGLLGYNYVLWGGANKAATLDLATMNAGATSNGFMMYGGSEWFGDGIASADLNHDGISDLIIGDSALAMGTDYGAVYVVYGHTGAWSNMIGTTSGITGVTGESTFKGGTYFGDRIGVVGDVNGDGYVDFVVNAPAADGTGGFDSGVSTLVFGTATGYSTASVIDLGTGITSTSYGIKIFGSEAYEYLGDIAWDRANNYNGDAYYSQALTISSIGDFTGDGIADFIIGSPGWGDGINSYSAPGRAYVVYGHTGSWSDMSAGDAATTGKGFIVTASNIGTNADLGFAVAGGSDYNKDGYADFLVTAVQASTNGLTNNGAVWLVFGKSGGYSGTVDLTTLVANGQALQWDGAASYNFMGTNVAMGDWNGDGYADVAIPQWKSTSNGATGAGALKIYYGNSSGLKGPTGTTPVTLDLNGDGQIGYSHVVMDVNGDGQKDLTAWTDATDGVLVWDKLGDGVVHDNSQYAFSQYGGNTDLQGLAVGFDTNQDGSFDSMDALFKQFSVWQDANQNGVSEAGEVKLLVDVGITSINLTSDGVQRNPAEGVAEFGQTSATLANGSTVLVADAGFDFTSLNALVQQANGTQRVDLSQDAAANTLQIRLSDVLAADQDVLVITADTHDVVQLDTTAWVNSGTTTTVNEHTYGLWSQAGAHLLIDTQAIVQPVL